MAHPIDVALMDKIKKHGPGGTLDVSACFNCGNCTAVCPLAEDSSGFPRRVIRMAQVGMEKELLADEDIWRCYACGECTQTCPREADPMQFMAAARSYAISRYDATGLAGLMYRSAAVNILVFLLLSAFFVLLLLSHKGGLQMGSNGAIFSGIGSTRLFQFIPGEWVHSIGVALFAVIGASLAFGVFSMIYRVMSKKNHAGERPAFPLAALLPSIGSAVTDALNHRRFRNCEQTTEPTNEPVYRRAWFVHGTIMWGFLAMLIATTVDFLFKPIGSPVPPWYSMRLLGLLGGVVCLYGLTVAISAQNRRQRNTLRQELLLRLVLPVASCGYRPYRTADRDRRLHAASYDFRICNLPHSHRSGHGHPDHDAADKIRARRLPNAGPGPA